MIVVGNNRLLLVLACILFAGTATAERAAVIKMRSDDILYSGEIRKENVAQFIALYDAQERKPTLVTVQSTGGDAEAGLQFGEFIFDHGLNVRILNYCFSACANYVFTAGKIKYVTRKAIIGWHGAPTSRYVNINGKRVRLDCDSDDGCADELASRAVDASLDCATYKNCDEARPKLIASFKATLSSLMSRHHALFEKTGVDERVTVYGQEIDCNCAWTFSTEDMRKFKIRNIRDNQTAHFLESSLADVREQTKIRMATRLLKLPAP